MTTYVEITLAEYTRAIRHARLMSTREGGQTYINAYGRRYYQEHDGNCYRYYMDTDQGEK